MDTRIKSGITNVGLAGVALVMIGLSYRLIGFEHTVLGVLTLYLWRWFKE